ncbi:MAG: carbohydrate binding domain-containing protein [Thermoplasmatota archaeon]
MPLDVRNKQLFVLAIIATLSLLSTGVFASPTQAPLRQLTTLPVAINLLLNSGFEAGLAGWHTSEGSAVYTADSSNPHSGTMSAKGVETQEGSLGRLYQDVTPFGHAGSKFQIKGWLKTTNVNGAAVIALDYVAKGGWTPGDGYVREIGYASGTTGWTHYQSEPFTLPAMPADASALWFLFDFNAGAGTAWWDDVELECISSCLPTPTVPALPVNLPHVIIADVPITITNTASSPTSSGYEQLVEVNSSRYATFEASDLRNVEFRYANGSIISSWLESGASKASTNTRYWLRIDPSIPARSDLMVKMSFALPNQDVRNDVTTGEAPTLSQTYGKYDDGASVFMLYDNFAGGSLSSKWNVEIGHFCFAWGCGGNGSVVVNDGLTLTSVGDTSLTSVAKFGPGTVVDANVTQIQDMTMVGYVIPYPPSYDGNAVFYGAFIQTACGQTYPTQVNAQGEANACGNPYGSFSSGSKTGLFSVSIIDNVSSDQSIDGHRGSASEPINRNAPTYPVPVGFGAANTNQLKVQWVRLRLAPPDGVMPTTELSALVYPSIPPGLQT